MAAASALAQPKPRPGREARQRRLGAAAMVALGAVSLVLVMQQRWSEQAGAMRDFRSSGPLRASVAVDGSAQLGHAVQALQRGEAFGWVNSFCVPPQTAVLMQARLVRVADGQVVLTRDREIPGDARGCSSSAWDIVLPATLAAGPYRLERSLLVTPATGAPSLRALPAMAVTVLE